MKIERFENTGAARPVLSPLNWRAGNESREQTILGNRYFCFNFLDKIAVLSDATVTVNCQF